MPWKQTLRALKPMGLRGSAHGVRLFVRASRRTFIWGCHEVKDNRGDIV